ncbi:MAG: nucleotidyltransferase substrate binding protein, partial [Veillonellales bacterium]
FTFEAVWKAAQGYLRTVEGMDAASPKGVIRACREVGLLDESEVMLALKMADDRNLTVHTYNEPLAAIYERILTYHLLLANWLAAMKQRV